MCRRAFLRRAATMAAAPLVIPATALGRDGAAAPSDRVVMGGIGIGGRGSGDLGALMHWPDCVFVANCDVRGDRRERVKARIDQHNGNTDCTAYVDFRHLLARDDIDAVLIATSDRWHTPLSVHAMRAGKDVYCEKPCSVNIAEGRVLADTQRRYARVYQAGTQRRSEEHFVFAMEAARTGLLGKVHSLTAHICLGLPGHHWLPEQPLPPRQELAWDLYLGPAPWRPFNKGYLGWGGKLDMHGGGITEWGSHTIDMCQWANDTNHTGPVAYEFPGNNSGEGLVAHYANGVRLVLTGRGFPGSCGVRFEGSEGWAQSADGAGATYEPKSLGGVRKRVIQNYLAQSQRPLNHWRDFLDCVKSRRQAVAPAETAHRSVSACHCATICVRLGRNLKWDPAKEEFIGDEEADRMRTTPRRAPYAV
jgi:predicted dehydrogenase